MKYHENLQLLCKLQGVDAQIKEEQLGIQKLLFRTEKGGGSFIVDATDTNLGGRLFIQSVAVHLDPSSMRYVAWADEIYFNEGFKQAAQAFFSDIWGDFSPTKRTLLYGIATCSMVEIVWKEGFFDQ